MKSKRKAHTASFLVSNFLLSKRSLKPIYNLCPISISVLRYIADCIDITFNKTKKTHAKLSHSQIAAYARTSVASVKRALQLLKDKRLLKFKKKSGLYEIGIIIVRWLSVSERSKNSQLTQTQGIDIAHTELTHRYSSQGAISNSSNYSNTGGSSNPEDQNPEIKSEKTLVEKIQLEKDATQAREDIRALCKSFKNIINGGIHGNRN